MQRSYNPHTCIQWIHVYSSDFLRCPIQKFFAYILNILYNIMRENREHNILRLNRQNNTIKCKFDQFQAITVQSAQITGVQALVNCAIFTNRQETVILSQKPVDNGEIFWYAMVTMNEAVSQRAATGNGMTVKRKASGKRFSDTS